jgi:hypothetical protein
VLEITLPLNPSKIRLSFKRVKRRLLSLTEKPLKELVYNERKCPIGWKLQAKVCIWENPNLKSKTPILDSLSADKTEFPTPGPVKKPSRLDYRNRGLTSLLYGDSF